MVFHQGRRASRLPLAIISRAFGASIPHWRFDPALELRSRTGASIRALALRSLILHQSTQAEGPD